MYRTSFRLSALPLLLLLVMLAGCTTIRYAVVHEITVATPVILPNGGTFPTPQTVTLTDATPGTAIFYTIDGSVPSSASLRYSAPFLVAQSEAIRAIATAPGNADSAQAFAVFTVTPVVVPTAATPVFTPLAGTYNSAQNVAITDATPGATIYYTTDGTVPTTASVTYAGPIAVASSRTVQAIAVAAGYNTSAIASAAYTINIPTAAAPTFSPPAGSYSSAQSVALADSTPGAAIHYTVDGSIPTAASPVYTTPISVSTSETVNAIAIATGYTNSPVATSAYVISIPVAAAPTFSPPAGSYSSAQSVALADSTPGAAIHYTLDGSTPTAASPVYTTPISVSTSETVNAIAIATGYTNSPVATSAYVISIPAVAAPTFSPPAGTYAVAQNVTISSSTPGATIYYTTDGTTPTIASTRYTVPVVVSMSETLGAIAVATGYANSPVATAAYVIQPAAALCANPGPGVICTIAGSDLRGYSGDGGPAVSATLQTPVSGVFDSSGNYYFADSNNQRIRRITPAGLISTFAGNGSRSFGGDGGPAIGASFSAPVGLAIDARDNIYVADEFNDRIRKITPAGIISTVAGSTYGFSGDGGPAVGAQLEDPSGVAVDSAGNLYIADSFNNRIRKVDTSGIISTVAGIGGTVIGAPNFSGDGGPATAAQLSYPFGVAVDSSGTIYISDIYNYRIRKVDHAGMISTVAGNGTCSFGGDGGPAIAAAICFPWTMAIDNKGDLYFPDTENQRIRMIAPAGGISTVAGNGVAGFAGDGGLATNAELFAPEGVAIDAAGNLYIADQYNQRIRRVNAIAAAAPVFAPPAGIYSSSQTVSITSATAGASIYYTTDGSVPTTASTLYSGPIAVSTSKTIQAMAVASGYANSSVATAAYVIQSVGIITTIAGSGSQGYRGDGGPPLNASFNDPGGLALDSAGNLYIADELNSRVRRLTTSGVLSTVAGNGVGGYNGDGIPATLAELHYPPDIALDATGDLLIADWINFRVRKVTPAGVISTIAGNGNQTFSGDGGLATSASFTDMGAVAVDRAGNVYAGDEMGHRIRKITPAGIISTVAGTGTPGFSGDGGPASSANLNSPEGIVTDSAGNLYIADTENNRVRKVSPLGAISTVAGNGQYGFGGDGSPAIDAIVWGPVALAVDNMDNLYIVDGGDGRIRKVTPAGIISTVVGNGLYGFAGDGGPALDATLGNVFGIAVDQVGNIYLSDSSNNRIRKVTY